MLLKGYSNMKVIIIFVSGIILQCFAFMCRINRQSEENRHTFYSTYTLTNSY